MNTQPPIVLTDASFKTEVLESDQPVLVDFWAPWCGPCHLLAPTIEELARQYAGSVRVGKLNVDENPDTARAYGISSIPAVFLFKAGEVVERFVGLQPKQRFEQVLERAKSGSYAAVRNEAREDS